MIARSPSTTSATTSSLSGPRARASASTAMVTVGEKLTTSVARRAASAIRSGPCAPGRIGSHGQAAQAATNSSANIVPMSTAPKRANAGSFGRSRATLISRPATKAISAMARPLTIRSSRAIGVEIRLAAKGPQAMPKAR